MSLLNRWSAEGDLNPVAHQQLNRYIDLLLEWNPRINLTGFRTRDEIEEILVGESLRAVKLLTLAGKKVLDFGSGAGVPGLIWLMVEPSIHLTSVEVREKKVAFQKEVLRSLHLSAEVVRGRFPEAVTERQFQVIVSRAIRFSPFLWRDASEMLTPGGMLVRFVAPDASPEDGWEKIFLSPRSALLIRTKL